MTTTDTTAAQRLAEHLSGLADHLAEHRHLAVVWTQSDRTHLECQITGAEDRAGSLIAWAESLDTVDRITVTMINGDAFVYLHGNLDHGCGATPVAVWDVIVGLAERHGWATGDPQREITLDVLRDFATSTTRVEDIEQAHAEALDQHRDVLAPHRVRPTEPATRVENIDLAFAEAISEAVDRTLHPGEKLDRDPIVASFCPPHFTTDQQYAEWVANLDLDKRSHRFQLEAEKCRNWLAAHGTDTADTSTVTPRRVPTIRTTDGTDNVLVTVDHGIDTDTSDRDIPVVVLRVGTGVAYLTLDQADELIEHLHDAANKAYRGNADSANVAGELVLGGTR